VLRAGDAMNWGKTLHLLCFPEWLGTLLGCHGFPPLSRPLRAKERALALALYLNNRKRQSKHDIGYEKFIDHGPGPVRWKGVWRWSPLWRCWPETPGTRSRPAACARRLLFFPDSLGCPHQRFADIVEQLVLTSESPGIADGMNAHPWRTNALEQGMNIATEALMLEAGNTDPLLCKSETAGKTRQGRRKIHWRRAGKDGQQYERLGGPFFFNGGTLL
jgi:hypothetical protein